MLTSNPRKKQGLREQAMPARHALPAVPPPSWHCTRLFATEAASPPPNGNTSSKTRKQPWGEGSPAKGGAPGNRTPGRAGYCERRPKQGGSWLRAPSTGHPAAGSAGRRPRRRPGSRGGRLRRREARETNRHYVRRKSKSKSSFPHILFSWSRLKGLEGKELNEEVLARSLDPRGPIKPRGHEPGHILAPQSLS